MATSTRPKDAQTGNGLLDRLPRSDFKRLVEKLDLVHLSAREIVYRADDPVKHLYFPITAVLTLLVEEAPADGRSLEFTSVGKEGMVGFTALLGVPNSLHHVACHSAGSCRRMPTAVLVEAMSRHGAVDVLFKRYMAVAYRAAIQAVICNALHDVEQRICRWLVSNKEKSAGDVTATQDLLAAILGVKRPTVSLVANSLQKAGLISYHRGNVRILDLEALEQSACACHRITKALYARILNQ